MFFHDEVGIIGMRYRADIDKACFAHHSQHKPSFAFYHLPVLVAVTGNERISSMGAEVVVYKNEIARFGDELVVNELAGLFPKANEVAHGFRRLTRFFIVDLFGSIEADEWPFSIAI